MTPVLLVVEQLRREVPGGIGTFSTGLIQGLNAMSAGPPGTSSLDSEVPPITLYASRAPGGSHRQDPLAGYGRAVRSSWLPGPVLTRAWDLGLVHAPSGFPIVHSVSLAAPPLRGRDPALVVTVHDLAWRVVPDTFPARGRRWHEASLHRAFRRARRFVVPATTIADELVAAGADPSSVVVIPGGSDHLPPADDQGAQGLLARLGVRGEFLLSVGTLEPRKNLERLFLAYGMCRAELPEPWPLVVVGPSGWGTVSRDLDSARDLDGAGGLGGIVATGRVSDGVLAALYRRARLLVYVPLYEGFGLPAVEAMRAGTPVLASPIPSVGDAAAKVDPLVPESIAKSMLSVACDETVRGSLVRAGLSHTEEMTWERTARLHVELWDGL